MEKKKILFVTQQLTCGGVEKALVNLLNLADRDKYDCEILVIEDRGEFRDFFPDWINIREYKNPIYVKMLTNYYRFPQIEKGDSLSVKLSKHFWRTMLFINKCTVKFLHKNIVYRIVFERYKKQNQLPEYDMLIDFHGYGVFTTFWTAYHKTKAKKVSWIHEETIYGTYRDIGCAYKYFDKIFGVSKLCQSNFIKQFPKCKDKVSIYYNFLDTDEIVSKAKAARPEIMMKDTFNIVSVGRVSEQKSFSRVIDTAQILKSKGLEFYWIIVGNGDQYDDLVEKVKHQGLETYVNFIGYSDNPYVYISNADLYVQTSRAEGFCTTISEAIVLGKPVVSTRVGGIDEQLDNGQGGIVTEHTAEALANAIGSLIQDRDKLNKFTEHNKNKDMSFSKEIEKLWNVLEE